MTNTKKQECTCGNNTYHLQIAWMNGTHFLASCTECGRITSSVGDGPIYRGDNIRRFEDD